MVHRTPKYRPRRMNQYVPAMAYSAAMIHEGPYDVNFGPMAVASATDIVNAQDATAGVTFLYGNATATALLKDNTDPVVAASQAEFPYGPGFGRCLQVVLGGAGAVAVNIYGRDYLGQPMRETLTTNGNTPVVGTKAFKWLDKITIAAVAQTVSIGTTDKLGLPYRMANILAEHLDGVRVATLGTLVTPSQVDPQTATTTDPRGTYDPQSTLNGTAYLSATFLANERLNASGNGGLHGLAHYYA